MHKKVFLFDLDGTLFDTAPDFEATINYFRKQQSTRSLTIDEILPLVNSGAAAMTELAFLIPENDVNFPRYKQQLLDLYTTNIGKYGGLYDGMAELLLSFAHSDHPWGIATNKPRKYAEKYLGYLPAQPTLLICGDDVEKPKPDAMMLLKAAEKLAISPNRIGYAGDHERDIIAAKLAGMHSVAAAYGYIPLHQNPSDWQADKVAESSTELAQLIANFTQVSL